LTREIKEETGIIPKLNI